MMDGNLPVNTFQYNTSLYIHPSGRDCSHESETVPLSYGTSSRQFTKQNSDNIYQLSLQDDVSIPQADGNITLDSDDDITGLTEAEIYEKDPELALSGYTFEDENEELVSTASSASNKVSQFSS